MPPNDFSNHLARWVYRHHSTSVVYVELRPHQARVFQRWNTVNPIIAEGAAGLAERARRTEESGRTKYCTGFFVAAQIPDPYGLFVLTCAHVLAPVFSADMTITAEQVAEMYEPHLLCCHREQTYLEGPDVERQFTRGRVHSISCENDLLLIRFTRVHIQNYCLQLHRPLSFAFEFPSPLKEVVMISWPGVGRSLVTVTGTASQPTDC